MPGREAGAPGRLFARHPASEGGIGLTGRAAGLGDRGASAAPIETYADADGLVQWAEMIALPADYLLLAGLPHGRHG